MAWSHDYSDDYHSKSPELLNAMDPDKAVSHMLDYSRVEDFGGNPFANQESELSEMPKAEAKEDLYNYDPDVTEDPEIPEIEDEQYDQPTTRMASLIANKYQNPKMTRLEDNEPSSMMHNQMTSEEVYKWLQEPSDQVMFDWYDWPNQEDNKKQQRLHRLELWRNYWTGDLGPDFQMDG